MTDVTEKVRETFETVATHVPVPRFDEVAFRSKVRRARRRRAGIMAVGAGAAAGVVAVALFAVPPLLDGDRADSDVAGQPTQTLRPDVLPAPLYYSAGMRLMAATPDGEVHDLGPSESIVGSTAEGVLAVNIDSELMWIGASSSGEGDGTYTFERGAGPVTLPETGPVQSVALSADGRWLAWLDLEDVVTVYDLKAGATTQSVEVHHNGYVTSVSDRGVLVSEGGRLTLYGSPDVEVPTMADGYGWLSDTAGDFVTVADRDDVTRVYDVTQEAHEGVARLVDSVPGTGRLAPYARGIVSIKGSTVWLWAAEGEPSAMSGLDARPQTAGWLDEDYAVVTTGDATGTVIYLCPVEDRSCTPVAFSEADVRLAE
jgi:hypothetical protein